MTTKDAFLQIAGKHGAHATMNIECGGRASRGFPLNARRTLTTMSAELSAEFATFEPDDVLIEWVRGAQPAPFEPQSPDADATYAARRESICRELEPLVAFPDTVVENSRPVGEAAG